MKPNKFIIILSLILILSCEQEYCYNYSINNISQVDIELIFYRTIIQNKIIGKKMQLEQSSFCDDRGNKSYFEYNLTDSIQIKVNNSIKKTYYPNDTGKSIFNTQDRASWKLVENKDNYNKFVFEITDQDLL